MDHREPHKSDKKRSVLGGKKEISGVDPKKKSSVEKAAVDKHAVDACDSALDGPECIEGVPEKGRH
jgi:hypothetical protein